MTQTEFFPLGNRDIEEQLVSEDFTLLLGKGTSKWKELGYQFPADALLQFRMTQISISQDLLQETMRLAAVVCKGVSPSELRNIAKSALILFATEPSNSAKEIMKETGVYSRSDIDAATPEVKKVAKILQTINAKYTTLVFPDNSRNPFLAFDKAAIQAARKDRSSSLKGNKDVLGNRWTWNKNKEKQTKKDDVRITINGKEYTLEQFMEHTKC